MPLSPCPMCTHTPVNCALPNLRMLLCSCHIRVSKRPFLEPQTACVCLQLSLAHLANPDPNSATNAGGWLCHRGMHACISSAGSLSHWPRLAHHLTATCNASASHSSATHCHPPCTFFLLMHGTLHNFVKPSVLPLPCSGSERALRCDPYGHVHPTHAHEQALRGNVRKCGLWHVSG